MSGTKFSGKNSTETPENSAQQSTINSERHVNVNNVGSRPLDSTGSYTRAVKAEAPTIQHSNHDVFASRKDFLELQEQMKALQVQLQGLLTATKAPPPMPLLQHPFMGWAPAQRQ